ncbi:hypothetical protein SAMN05444161_4679 [Rhizobiales bacterium GAS191]|nr:hypothetical protein SAMN05444161_4679 [Rhizobiales bacterium GAS191]
MRGGDYGIPVGGYGSAKPRIVLNNGNEHELLSVAEKIEAFWTAHFK